MTDSSPPNSENFYIPVQKILITPGNAESRLDRWLRRQLPFESFSILQKWIRTGQIRIDGKRAKGATPVKPGQEVRIPPRFSSNSVPFEKERPRTDPKWTALLQKSILFEDDHLIVFNKPAGLAVQGGTKTLVSMDNLVKDLSLKGSQDFRLTHRLDKDTSGIIILAKTAQDAAWITGLFKENQIQKEYWALVIGHPVQKSGVIDLPLLKGVDQAREKMQVNLEEGLPARTRYQVQETKGGLSWMIFYPETGRTHQVRLHSASLGCPVVGDGKYGGKEAHPFPQRSRLHLHAYRLTLSYPSGAKKTFTAPLPLEFQETLKRVGFQNRS